MYGPQARFFEDEIRPHLRHKKKGVLGMASASPPLSPPASSSPPSPWFRNSKFHVVRCAGGGENLNASQFYITTGAELDSLDD